MYIYIYIYIKLFDFNHIKLSFLTLLTSTPSSAGQDALNCDRPLALWPHPTRNKTCQAGDKGERSYTTATLMGNQQVDPAHHQFFSGFTHVPAPTTGSIPLGNGVSSSEQV